MTLVKKYIRCHQCNRKIYHNDLLIILPDNNENTHYYCSLNCANQDLGFMGPAEDLAPFAFYDQWNSVTDKPFKKDLQANKKRISTNSANLAKALQYIRQKVGVNAAAMAKNLNLDPAKLTQIEQGQTDLFSVKNIFSIKTMIAEIADQYNLAKDDYLILKKGYENTYQDKY